MWSKRVTYEEKMKDKLKNLAVKSLYKVQWVKTIGLGGSQKVAAVYMNMMLYYTQ